MVVACMWLEISKYLKIYAFFFFNVNSCLVRRWFWHVSKLCGQNNWNVNDDAVYKKRCKLNNSFFYFSKKELVSLLHFGNIRQTLYSKEQSKLKYKKTWKFSSSRFRQPYLCVAFIKKNIKNKKFGKTLKV